MPKLSAILLAGLCLQATTFGAAASDKVHRLALQISDNDADKMTAVLNVATNVAQHYAAKGEDVEIRIVAFNAGLHMLRTDTSPVRERVEGFAKSMPNVAFNACGNTIQGMTRREGKAPPIVANASVVPAGAVTLIELSEAGWTIVRP